ncbi:pentatricopeptide repeat-containing protein At1g69290 [Punica granatum]|uniref:Pentatricopeptide repeat-containing protein At1g69290 n=1 Tax=Punica granatum TaxID=22663 RepID=A0A6P8CSZ5_PUNGR|nr:pentatricopeptide repeat-containing protein At1g69290 [Punica granatum]
MHRSALHLHLHLRLRRHRTFSSSASSAGAPPLYSFLQPSIFAHKKQPPQPDPTSGGLQTEQQGRPKTLTSELKSTLETTLHKAVLTSDTDGAWKSFKTLTSYSDFPSKSVTNALIAHLVSLGDTHNLKRAFASMVYLIEKKPNLVDFGTVVTLLDSIRCADTPAPAFALIKSMIKNRFFVPFGLWGNVLVEISQKSGHLVSFLRVFEEICRVALDEKLEYMKPDLAACNAAMEACCRYLESVTDAEKVVETMSVLGIRPDESSLGSLGYLYALKGLEDKISELEILMDGFGLTDDRVFYSHLIDGYVKVGNLKSVTDTILRCQREGDGVCVNFGEETYSEVVKGFLEKGGIKELASLIIESQKLDSTATAVDRSIGYGLINACVNLGQSDKAHCILDEMNISGCSVGLGVYVPILKAYGKEHRTAEATQLVMDISNSGLQLDSGSYDTLIEASMSCQDFQSAFTLFRDMRDTRVRDLKGSYLTIMTGLMENHRPELMAAYLDEVVEDPRVEVGTHDWNSIIHAFCKAGRLEDARRTFRRMVFLQFEPNGQTYLSLINGYVAAEKYFGVLMLWNEVKRKVSAETSKGVKFDHSLVDAFLYALVKGGFFDAVMQVVEKAQEMKIFVDKWRYKQAFMETHKKLRVNKLRKRNMRKMEALVAFKNWAGLNA